MARRAVRYRDQDASDPAFKRIVEPDWVPPARTKEQAWGRYANHVWPIEKS